MKIEKKLHSRNEKGNPIVALLATLILMYAISGVLLFFLAFALYKLELTETVVRIVIMIIYVVSGLVGGLFIGKWQKSRKYIWGFAVGSMYFVLLFIFSLIMKQGFEIELVRVLTIGIMCIASSTVGGMIS